MRVDDLLKNDPLWKALNKRSKEIDKIFNGERTKENQEKLEDLLQEVVKEMEEM